MLFNSYEFIFLFLPVTFFVYFRLNQKRLTQLSKAWMVFASLFFYSWWNIIYLPLILCSILFNFAVGSTITKMGNTTTKQGLSKKSLLTFGIATNLLLLGYFKYMDFFIANVNTLFGTHWDLAYIILPLGISFFTFTQIAYLVDAYRNEVKEMNYLNYTLFVTFFPHLLAGPILHHKEMMPQFDSLKSKAINYKNIAAGSFLFSIGLFKKVIIADTFAQWANAGFDTVETLNIIEAWTTSLSYTLQLYFDFSGYTDMALGIALLFNIKLPINFDSPYKALDIQDFWRRWHITLSRFLRDYIYIPLGGNRYGTFQTYANLFTVFLIGGLWHGASWMFVIWGSLHGSAIVIHRIWKQLGFTMHKLLAWCITFNFINISWIFFRAKEWENAANVLSGMFYLPDYELTSRIMFQNASDNIHVFLWISVSMFVVLYFKNFKETNFILMKLREKTVMLHIYLLSLLLISVFEIGRRSLNNQDVTFLYYNF